MGAGKLTTIVAIDIAGYSALSQADEEAAIAAVARLGARCEQSANAHGGRIFNKAGDSVMMEFSSIAAGLHAAAELALNPDPPIRVGVHLGEVSELPNGDLLGHGVNVAARLQAQARPGHVLVSEDARRALRGPLARRLVSKGIVKLDKIDERIGVYELAAEDHAVSRVDGAQRDARRLRSAAIAAIAVAAILVVTVMAWPLLTTQPTARVAVFSPSTAEAGEIEALANGIADDVALALTAIGVETVARSETAHVTHEERLHRARTLGADLTMDGTTEVSAGSVRLTISVVRTNDRTTLWSQAFEASAQELPALRGRAAELSADVLICAVRVMRSKRGQMESETLGLMLHGCAQRRQNERLMDLRDSMMRVIQRDPGIPYARALLALSNAMVADSAPETMQAALLEEAQTEARRAIREAPDIGESYLALALLEPTQNWNVREQFLQQAVERDELNGTTHNFYAVFLNEVGRSAEALAYTQRAVALDPLSGPKRRYLAYQLALNGRHEEARALLEEMAAVWTDDQQVWRARFRIALSSGALGEAAALLEDASAQTQSSNVRTCWRHALRAFREAPVAGPAFQGVLGCDAARHLPGDVTDKLLVAVGDLDGAFARGARLDAEALFGGPSDALRADPRFMPLMRDLGLLGYWRLSGHWPDFCRDPDLPYRCQAEAQRLL